MILDKALKDAGRKSISKDPTPSHNTKLLK
jgi:hypothetical protein